VTGVQTCALPISTQAPPIERWAADLFAAQDAASLQQAAETARTNGRIVAPALIDALARSFAGETNPAFQLQKQRTALQVVADFAEQFTGRLPAWKPTLTRAQRNPELQPVATLILASLGDEEAAPALDRAWTTALRQLVFLEALKAKGLGIEVEEAVAESRARHNRLTRGLRRRVARASPAALRPVAEGYWDSWGWLGQLEGERYRAALFTAAFPFQPGPLGAGLRQDEDLARNVRAARRTLDALAAGDSALAAAAAGLTLLQQAPQYVNVRDRIVARLAESFVELNPLAQQRVTWAISQLTSRHFATFSPQNVPEDVDARAVADVYAWIREQHLAGVPADPILRGYRPRPAYRYRVITNAVRLERQLLEDFEADWRTANRALQQWLAAELGWTDRLAPLIDPTQAEPHYPRLAAAMVIAAANDRHELRPVIELWEFATDQPAWVRALAYTVRAAWEIRRGLADTDWPADLTTEALAAFGPNDPRWGVFGRVIAAGGPSMMTRLEMAAHLKPALVERLIAAARRADVLADASEP